MSYANTRLIKEDVLFRGGEPKVGSQYNNEVIAYINRVYFGICSGASEFVPEFIDDWWWLRDRGTLILQPMYRTGALTVIQNSTTITFTAPPPTSVTGYQLKVDGHPEKFNIASHVGGQSTAELDYAWTGPSVIGATFSLGKTTYTLPSAVQALMAPMTSHAGLVQGMTPETLDASFPADELLPGIPHAFALEDDQTVRFSHAGRDDGFALRLDFIYRPVVADLTDDTASIPLIPAQFRHVLADGALAYLRDVKGDSAAASASAAARQVLVAMVKENRRRFTKLDRALFHIFPRLAGTRLRPALDAPPE